MLASSKPRRMWGQSLWAGVVHTPGESRLGGLRRVQAPPAAQADLTPSGGGLHPPSWVTEQTHISSYSRSRSSSRQKQQPYCQSQLGKLQAGLADGHCHFRASHKIWLMRGTPHPPSHGRSLSTTPLPGRPSARSRRVCPQRGQPNGNEEEAGKVCCPDTSQDNLRAPSQPAMGLSTPGSDPEPQNLCL